MNGPCVQKDDFEIVRPYLAEADMVVFASPIYYFGLSAQLKTTIDRFYALNSSLQHSKKCSLLISQANNADYVAEPALIHYRAMADYLGWKSMGEVVAKGGWGMGDVKNTVYAKEAYELGRNL